jgi:hypothetical protein
MSEPPPVPASASAFPCPSCGGSENEKVKYTWWGGLLGPKLFSVVRCTNCKASYSGKTGKPCTTAIAIYLIVSLVIGLTIALLIILNS